MSKKIATLLLSIAALVPMALPVRAATTADALAQPLLWRIDSSSSKITMDGTSNLIASHHTKSSRRSSQNRTKYGKSNPNARQYTKKLSRSEIGRRTRARIGCGRVQDPCFGPSVR